MRGIVFAIFTLQMNFIGTLWPRAFTDSRRND